MKDYQPLLDAIASSPLAPWRQQLPEQINRGLDHRRWGDLPAWQARLAELPALTPSYVDFSESVTIGTEDDCSDEEREQLTQALRGLMPWRKGPFWTYGVHVDTEWRSDWKWDRVLPHLAPLKDRLVLDVGCGNGYHCWRMLGQGAARVIGIDPSARFVMQFLAMKQLASGENPSRYPVDLLPLGVEALPPKLQAFDTVFSMGVLYHRRSPMDHLRELKEAIRPGGQLVLETLVIEGKQGEVLVPEGRYGKMNNVWFLPSCPTLISWMRKLGFKEPRLVDLCPTSTQEQRATDWMVFQSLEDFLDPTDPKRTIEGHPAPIRAVLVAEV